MSRFGTRRRFGPALLFTAAAAVVAAGCGSSTPSTIAGGPGVAASHPAGTAASAAPSAPSSGTATPAKTASYPVVRVNTVDFGFESPMEVAPGLTQLQVTNTAKEPHQVQIGKLNVGVTPDQVDGVLHGPVPQAVSALLTFVGGVDTVDPGQSASAVVNLASGDYEMLCYITTSDGTSHLVHGMAKPFTVTAGSAAPVPEPKADGEIQTKDMTITLPPGFTGKGRYLATNAGPQVHEAAIVKLAPGKTKDDLLAFFKAAEAGAPTGPPPFSDAGGPGGLSPGQKMWVDLDLAPGNYLLFCAIPDATKGFVPHFTEGMITELAIS